MTSRNKLVSFLLLFFLINSLFTVAVNPVLASKLVEDSWNTKTPMSQARYDLGVIAFGDKIYAIGGYAPVKYDGLSNVVVGINECYDTKTDTWVTLEPMITPRASFAIAAYNGKIYCIGGGGQDGLCGTNEVYDIATDSWSAKTAMPFNDSFLKAHVIDGKIFVITSYDLFMYNPVADSWTTKTRMPQPLITTVHSAVVDSKIIVTFLPKETPSRDLHHTYVMIYNPKTDVWSEGAESKFLLSYGGAGATTGVYAPKRVYVLGILEAYLFDALPTNRVYDPVRNAWSTAKVMPTARTHFGVAVVDDVLYVIGGILDVRWEDVPEKIPSLTMGPNGELIYIHFPSQPFVPTAINEQYVPIGYSSMPLPSESEPSKPPATYLVVTTLAITVGVIAAGLLVYFRKRKRERKISPR